MVEEILISNLSLFPNPSMGVFKLRLDSKMKTSFELEILSSTGQVLYVSSEEISEGLNEISINQPDLSNGLYLIKLKNSETGVLETIHFMKK